MNEWQVVWVPDPEWWGSAPVARAFGFEDLPLAVEQIGLMPGDPVFIAPDFTIDSGLLDFVLSADFRFLERETKRNYATDIRILLTYLSSRGVYWRRASPQDLLNYRSWRCDAPQNPRRIGGSKWNREAAAFTRLFKWAKVVPLPVDASRLEDRAADAVSARVSWLTPRTWGLWSDIGLRGHGRDGAPAWGWEARTEARNTSFVRFTLSSGLRRQEAGSLLTFELPAQRLQHGRYLHAQLAGAVTRSKNGRTYYASVESVGQVETYVQSERAWAVQRAQHLGRYEQLDQMRLVTKVTGGRARKVFWVDRNGVEGQQLLTRLGWQERQWLFLEGPQGPEPAWLWLTEQGMPMLPDRWNQVFTSTNSRCEEVLLTPAEREVGRDLRAVEVRGKTPYATPHSTRHSFALYMLILLNQLMEARFGLTKEDRRDFALLFGDPWWMVKTLLGHADVETTKRHYLAPVAHLQLESILASADADESQEVEDVDGVFARLARETAGIQDIDGLVDQVKVGS
ncbi:integrase [Streptomyces sp. 8L]|uniref:integrase n=1 Tax=Streptomyces sp. 8L TaxID=2877242 RepID=UPI001CD78D81|nr:integrase [Streptomyces sp. 8L]MCA1217839.1 integrase [Streptomyces sp. 8L]